MQRFREYLAEAIDFAPWHKTNEEDIRKEFEAALDKNVGRDHHTAESFMRQLNFRKDGTVSCRESDVYFSSTKLMPLDNGFVLPCQFHTAKRFHLKAPHLISAWGVPFFCQELYLENKGLKSLEHVKTKAKIRMSISCMILEEFNCDVTTKYLDFWNLGMDTLTGIDKAFKAECVSFNALALDCITSRAVCVMRIEGLKVLVAKLNHTSVRDRSFMDAINVMNQVLQNPSDDWLDGQEALIDAGLREYAKL